jgi:hypothetical protein
MFVEDEPRDLLVLHKVGLARINQEWHYHLATTAGRPRCGAAINRSEWRLLRLAQPPSDLCGRCARLLGPRASGLRPGRSEPSSAQQIALPFDDEPFLEEPEGLERKLPPSDADLLDQLLNDEPFDDE